MDLTSLLTVRWDAPYRFLASVVGLALVTVSAGGAHVFASLARGAENLSWTWIATPLTWVDEWILQYASSSSVVTLTLTGLAAGFTYNESPQVAKSRATASVWILAVVAAYASPLWLVLTAIVVGITVRAVMTHFGSDPHNVAEAWLLGVIHTFGGLVWAPFVLVVWPIETPSSRAEELQEAVATIRS